MVNSTSSNRRAAERLIAFGCELGQGELFAKPLEPAAASALLARSGQADRRTA